MTKITDKIMSYLEKIVTGNSRQFVNYWPVDLSAGPENEGSAIIQL